LMEMKATAIDPKFGTPFLARTREEAVMALRQANGDVQIAAGLLMRGIASLNDDENAPESRLQENGAIGAPQEENGQDKEEEPEEPQEMVPAWEEIKHPCLAPNAVAPSERQDRAARESEVSAQGLSASSAQIAAVDQARNADNDAQANASTQHKRRQDPSVQTTSGNHQKEPSCLAACVTAICGGSSGEQKQSSIYAP